MFRFFVLSLIAVATAEVIFDGPCPDVKPVKNFEFEAFQGTWYEIARYSNAGEEFANGKCTTAEYVVEGDKGKAKSTHVINGNKRYIEGDLTLVAPSKVMITYTFGGLSKNSYLTILDTDYKSYALGYSCKYFKDGNKHQVFSWQLSRSKKFDWEAKYKVESYLKTSKVLDSAKYVINDHSKEACKSTVTEAINEFLD